MGCCSCTGNAESCSFDITPEESLVARAEKQFPLSQLPAKDVVKELLSNQQNGQISLRNCQRAFTNLGLDCVFLSNSSKFFEFCTGGAQDFSTEKLVLTAILLGQGSYKEKLKLWFEFYDNEALGCLERCLLADMIEKLLRVASGLLPFLGSDQPHLLEYTGTLSSAVPVLHSKLVKALLNDSHFHQVEDLTWAFIENPDCHILFSSKKIRELLYLTSKGEGAKQLLTESTFFSPGKLLFRRTPAESASYASELLLHLEEDARPQPNGLDTSSVKDSDCSVLEPALVELRIGATVEKFLLYPDKDPAHALLELSRTRHFSALEKSRLLSALTEITINLA